MKRFSLVFLLGCIILSCCGCQKTLKGTNDLIEKAREEITIADSGDIHIEYAGACTKDGRALVWFISGNEYQEHYYLPMECTIVGENEYAYEQTFTPTKRGADIVVLGWRGGYAFLINNPICSMLRITDSTGTHDITIESDACPYVFYNDHVPSEYLFLDSEGNELS